MGGKLLQYTVLPIQHQQSITTQKVREVEKEEAK